MCKRFSILLFSIIFLQAINFAQVKLPKLFGDNMVLQRGIKITTNSTQK